MMSPWADALTEGFIPPLLDLLMKCDALTIAHLRATCKTWRKQCNCHLSHLELTPLPIDEFEKLAQMFPKVRSLTISRGRPNVRGCWLQTAHIKALATFSALNTVKLASMTHLRPEELRQLANMDKLRSLSLPSVLLDDGQQELLYNLPGLTSLSLGCWNVQDMPVAYSGHLQFLQLCAPSYIDKANCRNISKLASIPSLALTLGIQDNYKAVERLLLRQTNLRRVVLEAEYCEQTTALLEAVSQTSIVMELWLYIRLWKQEDVGCSHVYNWTTNTNITSLKLTSVLPCVVETSARMVGLLALEVSRLRRTLTHGFSFITQFTNLTSLRVSSEYVANTSWTCLYLLTALAHCSLEAMSHYICNIAYTTIMHHGSDALFYMDALTHLQVRALFPAPEITSRSSLRNVSSNLCSLEFEGREDVSDYFVYIISKMPCLTKLSVTGKTFPFLLSFISNLRWLKELRLLGSEVSVVDMDFVCGFQYLACLQLHYFDVNDDTFLHAAMLNKLTTLDLKCCPNLTDAVFLHVKNLVSLRELRIVNCDGVSPYSDGTSPSVLTCLRRLRFAMGTSLLSYSCQLGNLYLGHTYFLQLLLSGLAALMGTVFRCEFGPWTIFQASWRDVWNHGGM